MLFGTHVWFLTMNDHKVSFTVWTLIIIATDLLHTEPRMLFLTCIPLRVFIIGMAFRNSGSHWSLFIAEIDNTVSVRLKHSRLNHNKKGLNRTFLVVTNSSKSREKDSIAKNNWCLLSFMRCINWPSFFLASSKACSKLERASGEANSKTKLLSAEAVVNSSFVGRKVMLKARDCLSDSSLCTDAIRSLITSSRDWETHKRKKR